MNQTAYTYVNEHLISPSLICPICLDVLKDPHTHVSCDSAFCRSCLFQLAEPICPICRCSWTDLLWIEYNRHLPKTNRLIRNMLDELMVECLQCHTVRRRGQFEHQCRPMKSLIPIKTTKSDYFSIIFSLVIILLSILLIYSHHNIVFETTVHRQLINNIGIDIDKYLFDKIYYLIVKIIEYSLVIFLCNLFLWFILLFYGDRLISKTTNRMFKEFLERLIIINLITYSIYYENIYFFL